MAQIFVQKIQITRARTNARLAVFCLMFFGLTLVYGVGFAHSHLLHNAAHDVRHSSGFPCH